MTKGQKGFSAVEGLLILIIVVLVGTVGWYVGSSTKEANDTLNNATATSTSTPSKTSVSPSYLVIKEKGIKFKLSNQIKDAYYHVSSDGYIYLSLHRFDSMKGAEGCAATDDGLGILALVSGKVGAEDVNLPSGGMWTQKELDDSGMTKVGDTYYGFMRGNGPCWDVNNPPQPNFDDTMSNLRKAFFDQQSTIVAY